MCEEVIRLYSNIYKKHLSPYIHVTLTGRKVYAKISVYSETSTKSGDFFTYDRL